MHDEANTTIRITIAAIALGLLLAFFGALVSVAGHYYRLDALVLLAGALPYTLLGMLAGLMAGRSLAAIAAGVFAIHLAAVLLTDPGSGARAMAPLLLLLVPLVLLPRARLSDSAPLSTGGES
jgi:hypothetical protein